jgi:carbon-monoxide dehydrogenase medium subunit
VQVPAPFEYDRATSVDNALELLERLGPEARVVAGGHSLLPMMKLRLAVPEHLVDINDLEGELGYIRVEGDQIRIGALTRHRDILGTIGGALCQADPAEDLSAVCAACHAEVVVKSRQGERVLTMDDFHQGPYETAVGDGEMLTEVRLPMRSGPGSAYEKVERRAGDWAVAAIGAALWVENGQITNAGVGLSALGNVLRAGRAEEALKGKAPGEEAFEEAASIVSQDCAPATDGRGSEEYKRHLAAELTRRALRRAADRVSEGA